MEVGRQLDVIPTITSQMAFLRMQNGDHLCQWKKPWKSLTMPHLLCTHQQYLWRMPSLFDRSTTLLKGLIMRVLLEKRKSQKYMAMNLDPKVEASTVFCHLPYQRIRAWLHNIIYPVCGHLVMRFPAWPEFTYAVILTGAPSGLGLSASSSSSKSP